MKRTGVYGTMAIFVLAALLSGGLARAESGRMFEVTITNATRGQIISPPVIISHDGNFRIFQLGEPASLDLARLAEDGMPDGLVARAAESENVLDVALASGPVLPGESISVFVKSRGTFRYVTAAGMLVTTNDAFFGLDAARIPRRFEKSVHAYAYDAGSEANSESCAEIPGPPCNNPGVRNTAGAEGFVHIHSGIHGIADLVPALHDWRNPVVVVTIKPAR